MVDWNGTLHLCVAAVAVVADVVVAVVAVGAFVAAVGARAVWVVMDREWGSQFLFPLPPF